MSSSLSSEVPQHSQNRSQETQLDPRELPEDGVVAVEGADENCIGDRMPNQSRPMSALASRE
ncbi:hypothetical protein KEM55_005812 [Ascosphaera atra]|nr:hypothetical protein KEM55_005812 [Ascosphaera atra]